jgi:hypothetical protein
MLAAHATDDEASEADVNDRVGMPSTKRKASRNLGRRADTRRRSAPRIIDELF